MLNITQRYNFTVSLDDTINGYSVIKYINIHLHKFRIVSRNRCRPNAFMERTSLETRIAKAICSLLYPESDRDPVVYIHATNVIVILSSSSLM